MAESDAPLFLLGEQREVDGVRMLHVVFTADRANSALCGARVSDHRVIYLDATLATGTPCRTCYLLRSALVH